MGDTWPEPQILTRRQPGWKEGKREGERNSLCKCWEGRMCTAPIGSHKREKEGPGERTPDTTMCLECLAKWLRSS